MLGLPMNFSPPPHKQNTNLHIKLHIQEDVHVTHNALDTAAFPNGAKQRALCAVMDRVHLGMAKWF